MGSHIISVTVALQAYVGPIEPGAQGDDEQQGSVDQQVHPADGSHPVCYPSLYNADPICAPDAHQGIDW